MKKFNIQRISKSQYIKGVQCPKALWLFWHRKDLKPTIDDFTQHLFDTGHKIGKLATGLFDGGIEIIEDHRHIDDAIKSTDRTVLKGAKYIFEAIANSGDGAYSRIDILERTDENMWNLIEVKSTTSVKDYHLDDIAFQRYVFKKAGFDIDKSILMYINKEYVRFGSIEVEKFFILDDCTDIAESKQVSVESYIKELIEIVNDKNEPTGFDIGSRCKNPFKCDYFDYCWKDIPDYSVYDIFRGKKLDTLLENNIIDVMDIPADFGATERQFIDISSHRLNIIYKNYGKIKSFLDKISYPIYFLDYETINPAIPIFNNASSYQNIPFQFSLHIQETENEELKHVEFLHTQNDDPRPYLVKALTENCGDKGSVVVYNESFEKSINEKLGDVFPEYKDKLGNINERMIDLLTPFRGRYIYSPKMKGSASLKSVLPAFIDDCSYDDLIINDGMDASLQYLKCIQNVVSEPEKEKIYENLRKYCTLDTLAEVKLLSMLREV